MVDVSIIIPTLNEEKALPSTLTALQSIREKGVEIIVADGGSLDNTVQLAEGYVDQVITSLAGRAVQLNKGAAIARGRTLLFLHADTLLPNNALSLLQLISEQELQYWGRFNVKLDGSNFIFRIIEFMMNKRSCLTGIVTGDHAMFVSKELFENVGRYPEIDLMEDIAMSEKLKQRAELHCIKQSVVTSSRRWQQNGIMNTVILMWRLRLGYFFNKDPSLLAKQYRHNRFS